MVFSACVLFQATSEMPLVIQNRKRLSNFVLCWTATKPVNCSEFEDTEHIVVSFGRDPTRDGLDWKKNNKLWYALRYKQGGTGAGKSITALFPLLMLSRFVPWFPQFRWHRAP